MCTYIQAHRPKHLKIKVVDEKEKVSNATRNTQLTKWRAKSILMEWRWFPNRLLARTPGGATTDGRRRYEITWSPKNYWLFMTMSLSVSFAEKLYIPIGLTRLNGSRSKSMSSESESIYSHFVHRSIGSGPLARLVRWYMYVVLTVRCQTNRRRRSQPPFSLSCSL